MSLIKKLIAPPPMLIYNAIKDWGSNDSTEVVRAEELDRVQELIEKGREQGLSELDIEISHEFAAGFKAKAGATIESIPLNVTLKLKKSGNGKYIMKVKYLPKTYTDELRDLKKLNDDGVLTDDEFTQAKKRVLLKTHKG